MITCTNFWRSWPIQRLQQCLGPARARSKNLVHTCARCGGCCPARGVFLEQASGRPLTDQTVHTLSHSPIQTCPNVSTNKTWIVRNCEYARGRLLVNVQSCPFMKIVQKADDSVLVSHLLTMGRSVLL